MVYYCQHIYFKIKFHGESWISVEIFIPLQLIFINSMYKRKTWQTTRKQLQQKTSDWFVWPSDFFNCFAASNHLWKSHCWGQGTLDGLLFKAGWINGVKRWVQTDVIVQNTPRCTNPTLCVFCVCYLLLVLIPANNFSFRSCVSFGWEGRNRCSWRLNFGAKLSSGGCSDPLWRMLSCGSTVPALGRFVKDPQVLPGAYCQNPRLLHLFLFPGRTQARVLLLRWEEGGRFFLSACFPQKCSRPVLSRLIGLEHQAYWRRLKCRGAVGLRCLSSPPVMGRRTHLQAEGICLVGAGRLSVSSETRCAWQPLPRLRARTYSL